jgi:hypothetical protein
LIQLGHQALGQGAQLLRVHVLQLLGIDDHGRHHRCHRVLLAIAGLRDCATVEAMSAMASSRPMNS